MKFKRGNLHEGLARAALGGRVTSSLLVLLLITAGTAAHAGIQVSPGTLDFGDVPAWSLSERTIRVLPTGQGPHHLAGFTVIGNSDGAFRALPPTGYFPGMILPRGGLTFRVQFNPPTPYDSGVHPSTAEILFAETEGSSNSAVVLGSTTGQFVGGFFVPLEFGEQPVGSKVKGGMIARNPGTVRVQFVIVGVTMVPNEPFSPHPEFSVKTGTLILEPLSETQIPVTWDSQTLGLQEGWVEFNAYEEFVLYRYFVRVRGTAL